MAIDAVFPAASEVVMLYAGALAVGRVRVRRRPVRQRSTSGFWRVRRDGARGHDRLHARRDRIGWAIGIYGGRPYLERHGRWLHLSPPQLETAERWFDRWDGWAVFLGRITPVARSFISIPAGVFRMPLRPYTWLTLAGSTIWCIAFAGVGYALGDELRARSIESFRYVDYVVVVLRGDRRGLARTARTAALYGVTLSRRSGACADPR